MEYLKTRIKHNESAASSKAPELPNDSSRQGPAKVPASSRTQRSMASTSPIQMASRPLNIAEPREDILSTSPNPPGRLPRTYSSSLPGSYGQALKSPDREGFLPPPPCRMPPPPPPTYSQHSNKGNNDGPRGKAPPGPTDSHGHMFKPLEEYLVTCFATHECVNESFSTLRPHAAYRASSEGSKRPEAAPIDRQLLSEDLISDMDAKTLLIGDIAENGFWWTGERAESKNPDRSRWYRKNSSNEGLAERPDPVNLKSPHIDWALLSDWYHIMLNCGKAWSRQWKELVAAYPDVFDHEYLSVQEIQKIEEDISEAQHRIQRVLLKVTESLLKRPGRPLREPADIRFLLIILSNPLLYSSSNSGTVPVAHPRARSRSRDPRGPIQVPPGPAPPLHKPPSTTASETVSGRSSVPGQHSGIIKRVLGLLSNLSNECHHHLVAWFARFSESHFQRITDLVGSFVTYRLTRQHGKKRDEEVDVTAGLIPNLSNLGAGSSAQLHAALGSGRPAQVNKKADNKPKPVVYNDDWQIKAAARVMALLFSANNSGIARKSDPKKITTAQASHSVGLAARERAHTHGQIIATSDFYNTLLDYSDLIADFEAWETKRGKFAFCQYPFFLSIWAKIQIMEYDAKRQMEVKAREAFFNSIMSRKVVNQYLILRIRRECLVEDSLKSVSEVVGTGGEEIKKGLRIEFTGEEGIDAGGLRKEWFLLLVRDVFNPDHGKASLFIWTSFFADYTRFVHLRRGFPFLLLQPQQLRNLRPVLPRWGCPWSRHLQFYHPGCGPSSFRLPQTACSCTGGSTRHYVACSANCNTHP
jgi:E3 ubiquitin-protein ligase HECTD2